MKHGVELLASGPRRDRLTEWLAEDLPARFEGRLLVIDRAVAEGWGTFMTRTQRIGARVEPMDAFFAATAEAHGLTLVTRNVGHFQAAGIDVFDPWSQPIN